MGLDNQLRKKLESFISKYYQNLLLKGVLYFVAASLLFFIIISAIEHFGNFGTSIRTFLFWLLITVNSVILWKWILVPLKGLYRIGKSLTHQEAADIIGKHFSEVQDKLLNLLQLTELSAEDNDLIHASIQQKSKALSPVFFSNAINFSENKRYLKYTLFPIGILIFLFFSGNKNVVTESSARILSHNTHFEPRAPFQFVIKNNNLHGVKGDDFHLFVKCEGAEIPTTVYVSVEGVRYKLRAAKEGFSHLFKNPQNDVSFQFWADGFYSSAHTLSILPKPIITDFEVSIDYPPYTGKTNEQLKNIGNLQVPEGSKLHWKINTQHAEKIYFQLDNKLPLQRTSAFSFEFEKSFQHNATYGLFVENNNLVGDSIFYQIQVITDAFPKIEVSEILDSTNSFSRFYSGLAQDDYGLTKLTFNHRILSDTSQWISQEILLQENINQQGFHHHWDLNSANVSAGGTLEYFFELWDNDAINGHKSSRSQTLVYNAPTLDEQEQQASEKNKSLKEDLEKSIQLAEEINQEAKELKQQLLEEKELSWEDKQKTKSLLEKQLQLKEQVEALQQQQQQNQQEENRFNQADDELMKKKEQLQELFENIMTEEMKDMMQELQDMMEQIDKKQLQDMLEKMQQNDEDVEKELDRTLELFKQLELQQKLEKTAEKLNELAEKQNNLAKQGEQKKADKDVLQKEQEKLNEDFEKLEADLKKAEELNKELEEKQEIPELQSEEEEIKQEMQESLQKLQKNMKKKAAQSQKKAAQKMEEMSEKIQSAMQNNSAEGAKEDMESLRQILENLVTLSFEQESLLSEIELININSPLYTSFMHQQKKLQDDAQIIEDSLFALSKRQPQISSVVNREINALNSGMEKSLSFMEERLSAKASEKQQFSMTASNNLALLLSEILKQMQQQLSQQNKSESKKMCNKPNSSGGQSMKDLKSMQEGLKKQMKEMLKPQKGKGGKGEGKKKMSKKLAQMAAQQEMIRQRMQEIRGEMSGDQNAKKNIDRMLKEMEETETDLINRNITQQTLLRQQEILSRLLEAEKAHREREQDKTRQSQEWLNQLSNRLDNPFEEYQQEKKKQEELLRTSPPSLTPFYKNKVTEFFQNDER